MNSTAIAVRLGQAGLCVCPNFLGAKALVNLRADFDRLHTGGEFHRAGVGHGSELQSADEIRRDEVCWLNRGEDNSAQDSLWERLDTLQRAFNRTLFLGLRSFDGHYASYPAGGFYRRHLDNFRGNSNRLVSLVIYLNRDWQESHGGKLRVYETDSHRDVDPAGGTLVCFMSRETEHEVLPSSETRRSFSGWFKL